MPDQEDIFGFDDRWTFQADLDRLMMTAFGRGLDVSGLTPMAVMTAMAHAVGSVYRQVAAHHHQHSCPCGWQPLSEEDIATLQAAFETAAATPEPIDKLLTMPVMGRA
ncbi:MAG: hypothetical protein BGN84_04155 [Afipia sp. 62-7]|nr:MAG: hypothetical protein BGN84_04155 [Afipia sp. 62-7]